MRQHIALRQPTTAPAAANRLRIELMLVDQATHGRRERLCGLRRRLSGRRWRRRRSGRRLCHGTLLRGGDSPWPRRGGRGRGSRGRRLRSGARTVDACNDIADVDGGAFPGDDRDAAGAWSGDLDAGFVGLELEQRLVGGDDVACLLEPAHDHTLGDRFTEGGYLYVNGHATTSAARG